MIVSRAGRGPSRADGPSRTGPTPEDACQDGGVPERLSPLDVSFLYLEDGDTPMHVGSVAVFRVPDDGFDYDRLVSLIRVDLE